MSERYKFPVAEWSGAFANYSDIVKELERYERKVEKYTRVSKKFRKELVAVLKSAGSEIHTMRTVCQNLRKPFVD